MLYTFWYEFAVYEQIGNFVDIMNKKPNHSIEKKKMNCQHHFEVVS